MSVSSEAVDKLRKSLKSKGAILKSDSILVFTCGAAWSETDDIPSVRKTIMDYAERHLDGFRFFEAESFFEAFENEKNKDYLSLEEDLAGFSDCILILVESPGAQAELGAFTVKNELAKIVLAVNKREYHGETSFISRGPLAKIDQVSVFKPTVYANFDAILQCMPAIRDRLDRVKRDRGTTVDLSSYESYGSTTSKIRMLFILDLISLFSPVSYPDLIDILKALFGENDFKIKTVIAFLNALELIERKSGLLISQVEEHRLFFKYEGISTRGIRATVVRHYFKHARSRSKTLRQTRVPDLV